MATSSPAAAWVTCPRPNPRAALRLFCLPYAGGGPQIYYKWSAALPATVEVCPVQLPGRASRLAERPFTSLSHLVHALATALAPQLGKPFAVFGHSLGALLGFELARQIRRAYGLQPAHLFVSACTAPQEQRVRSPIHGLPEPAFLEEVRRLNGTPREVLEMPELLEMIIPVLRADFALIETYSFVAEGPLDCSITAFGGLQDDLTTREQLEAWREQTNASFAVRMLPGDHFFVNTAQPSLLRILHAELDALVSKAGGTGLP